MLDSVVCFFVAQRHTGNYQLTRQHSTFYWKNLQVLINSQSIPSCCVNNQYKQATLTEKDIIAHRKDSILAPPEFSVNMKYEMQMEDGKCTVVRWKQHHFMRITFEERGAIFEIKGAILITVLDVDVHLQEKKSVCTKSFTLQLPNPMAMTIAMG